MEETGRCPVLITQLGAIGVQAWSTHTPSLSSAGPAAALYLCLTIVGSCGALVLKNMEGTWATEVRSSTPSTTALTSSWARGSTS